jgi:hypothetical protein
MGLEAQAVLHSMMVSPLGSGEMGGNGEEKKLKEVNLRFSEFLATLCNHFTKNASSPFQRV